MRILTWSTVAEWYNTSTLSKSPAQINFLIFVPIFSIFSVLYLELSPRFMKKGKLPSMYCYPVTLCTDYFEAKDSTNMISAAAHPYAHLAVEIISALFHFAGFIALAVFLNRLLFCRGSVCHAARADAGFAALGWVLWMATTTLVAMEIFRGGFRPSSSKPTAMESKVVSSEV